MTVSLTQLILLNKIDCVRQNWYGKINRFIGACFRRGNTLFNEKLGVFFLAVVILSRFSINIRKSSSGAICLFRFIFINILWHTLSCKFLFNPPSPLFCECEYRSFYFVWFNMIVVCVCVVPAASISLSPRRFVHIYVQYKHIYIAFDLYLISM